MDIFHPLCLSVSKSHNSSDFVTLDICHAEIYHRPPVCHQMSCSQLLLHLDLSRFLLRHLTDPKTWMTIDDNKNDDDIPKYACGNDRYPISLLVNS